MKLPIEKGGYGSGRKKTKFDSTQYAETRKKLGFPSYPKASDLDIGDDIIITAGDNRGEIGQVAGFKSNEPSQIEVKLKTADGKPKTISIRRDELETYED